MGKSILSLEAAEARIDQVDDWIDCPRADFSLAVLKDRYPDGVPNQLLVKSLRLKESPDSYLEKIVARLRELVLGSGHDPKPEVAGVGDPDSAQSSAID